MLTQDITTAEAAQICFSLGVSYRTSSYFTRGGGGKQVQIKKLKKSKLKMFNISIINS